MNRFIKFITPSLSASSKSRSPTPLQNLVIGLPFPLGKFLFNVALSIVHLKEPYFWKRICRSSLTEFLFVLYLAAAVLLAPVSSSTVHWIHCFISLQYISKLQSISVDIVLNLLQGTHLGCMRNIQYCVNGHSQWLRNIACDVFAGT